MRSEIARVEIRSATGEEGALKSETSTTITMMIAPDINASVLIRVRFSILRLNVESRGDRKVNLGTVEGEV